MQKAARGGAAGASKAGRTEDLWVGSPRENMTLVFRGIDNNCSQCYLQAKK